MVMSEIFGSLVFNDTVMQERLPKYTYKELKTCIENGDPISLSCATVIANAMKDWAIEKGCTHFTHWFQPMTGITAEKHDAFIQPTHDGKVIMEFSGKELIKGEPDASSFPSGGIRATFEARGYTTWDPTSYAFVKDNTLCIPTAFVSYTGEVLDKKTPLLKSMEALSNKACRILKLFGKNARRVVTTVGPEQEYFLIDKSMYEKRKDLIFTGRTLFGAPAPKGQELEDHYFGTIKQRVVKYMCDLDVELWKLGVLAKTKHNEVAPAQHELAPIFTQSNVATDANQLTMEMMKKIASRHDMTCLLHEKPFAGVNGSGKHNNWSMSTDTGENLLEPGDTPEDNAQFLLFLVAVLKAVDDYQDLLRISVASAGNDHRLGANEAPPAIVSVFLGEELDGILTAIAEGRTYSKRARCDYEIGVSSLPKFKKDTTDRNRTSPFAFTGNKFEFRMLGSSFSIAGPNIILNTIVAESLDQFADELEGAEDFMAAVKALIKKTFIAHKRIVFNGNGYSDEWVKEAEKRGLLNLQSSPEALPYFRTAKNIALFEKHGIFSALEVESRTDILLENYSKVLNIEALTMIDMMAKDITPAVTTYIKELTDTAIAAKAVGIDAKTQVAVAKKLSDLCAAGYKQLDTLKSKVHKAETIANIQDKAMFYRTDVLPAMEALRKTADDMEVNTAEKYWPFPTYGDILFSIKE